MLDTALNTITADTTSLSPFVLAVSPVPEPAKLAILTVGAHALLGRRRACSGSASGEVHAAGRC